MKSKDRLLGVLFIVVSAASYGVMPIFGRLAYEAGTNPITLLFLRFAIASIFMIILMAAQGIAFPRGRTLIALIFMGALGYAGLSLTYFTALTLIPAGLVVILFYLYPAFVTVLAAMFLKKAITTVKVVALTMTFAGTVLIVRLDRGGGQILGVVLAIAAAVLCAAYMVISSKVIQKAGSFSASTVVSIACCVVFGGVVAVKGVKLPVTLMGWVWVTALALVSTTLAFVTLFAGLRRIDPANASIIYTLEPVIAVALAAIVLEETLSASKILGGVLILAAVILVARSEGKPSMVSGPSAGSG
jgi:drug/metabolite transporter (DMT)-like permease